ncbi:cytochrome c oxidase subunit II [Azospirillum halopraeferens]|uniref:cytochrome c oxidase subunit II n=1 Tax=Azospirillum halopraeferens TaxID=34010 RepID=UPI000402315E|nr:cytochrome c oxidase subunit II [Azospirillum halopraeferens]
MASRPRRPPLRPPARRPAAMIAAAAPAFLLSACGGSQSALHPAGTAARDIFEITLVLFIGGALIFVGVMAIAAYAVLARPERFRGGIGWILGGGVAFPVVVLFALQVYEFAMTRRIVAAGTPVDLTIEVTGVMWWWDVRYPDAGRGLDGVDGNRELRTANEIVVPAGRRVEFVLTTRDVIHSFWMPTLAGKLDMIPGHVNRLTLVADTPGVYRGQCAEFCGAQHALMAFDVIVLEPDAFDAWVRHRLQPPAEPRDELAARGRDAFLEAGCGACHAVRGTPATGTLGPDLTHVGSRLTLGAGVFPNSVGALAGWIASARHLKPENRMPSFDVLDGVTLRAIAAYLAELK